VRRFVFVTGPGPFDGGSKPGSEGWRHTPEKSGTEPCPRTGDAKAAAAAAKMKIFARMVTPSKIAPCDLRGARLYVA
jgi:hypothetical protein